MADDVTKLAFEYFHVGNIVVGFYVAQTILFMNALYKETLLRELVRGSPKESVRITWGFAAVYIAVIFGCYIAEHALWPNDDKHAMINEVNAAAAVGRIAIVAILAGACSRFIRRIDRLSLLAREIAPLPKA